MQLGVKNSFDALRIFGDRATASGLFKSTGDVLTFIGAVETLARYIEDSDEANRELESALLPKSKEQEALQKPRPLNAMEDA